MRKKNSVLILTMIIVTLLLVFFNNKQSIYEKDMNYFIETVIKNYPYSDKFLKNIDENQLLNEAKKCKTNDEFLELLDNSINELNGLGHLYILNAEEYYFHLATYESAVLKKEVSPNNPNLIKLRSNKIKKSYKEMANTTGITYQMVKDSLTENQTGDYSENLNFHIQDNCLIITINSFDLSFVDADITKIESELKSFNGDTIIFDIRENGGGADLYWVNLVQMTSFKDYHVQRKIYGNGNLSYQYVKNELGKDAVKKSGSSFIGSNDINIKSKKIIDFERIFILTSENNYSSSDSFIKFSNETGYATSVGQKTRGAGGDSLNPMLVELPQTHILFRLDAVRIDENSTIPDIETNEVDLKSLLDIILNH